MNALHLPLPLNLTLNYLNRLNPSEGVIEFVCITTAARTALRSEAVDGFSAGCVTLLSLFLSPRRNKS